MPLSHVLTNLDDARDTLVNSINSRGGNLEESATLYQCAAAVNTLASGVLSINGHLPDESGSVTMPDATQSASGLMSAEDKVRLDGLGENATQSSSGLMSAADKAKLDAVSADINPIGYLKLPGNLIFQWGSYSLSSNPDSREITLPVTVTATYGRFASSSNSAVKLGIAGASEGKISISASGANSGVVYWMVIGKVE